MTALSVVDATRLWKASVRAWPILGVVVFLGSLGFVALLLAIAVPAHATSQTYTVTVATDCGPGTIVDAIAKANANPGTDRIEFAPGITTILFPNCDGSAGPDSSDFFYLWASESVDIVAPQDVDPSTPGDQKLIIDGQQLWIDSGGQPRPQECPNGSTSLLIALSPGFVRVGTPNVDNTGLEVTVENVQIQRMNTYARVFRNGSLTVQDGVIRLNADLKGTCASETIHAADGVQLDIENTIFEENQFLAGSRDWVTAGVISAGTGSINISDSWFQGNIGQGAIATAGQLRIVSSKFESTGGILAFFSDVDIVNSAFTSVSTSHPWEGIYSVDGTVNISGSTFSGLTWPGPPSTFVFPGIEKASILRFEKTDVHLDGVAINGQSPPSSGTPLPLTNTGSGVTLSVKDSWASDGSLAGAAGPAPPWGLPEALPFWPGLVTPIQGGPLIDVIDNTTDPLIDPITSQPITLDVFGNPRVDGTMRDIGAVELQDAPHLIAQGGNTVVVLSWSVPAVPAGWTLTGYALRYRPTGTTTWLPTPHSDTTTAQIVTGLRNGTPYEFQAAAETTGGRLPWSNIATATPAAPPPGPRGVPVLSAGGLVAGLLMLWLLGLAVIGRRGPTTL